MGLMIVLNVVMMFVELEKTGYGYAVSLELRPDNGFWDGSASILEGIEHFFNFIFFVELLLRLVADFHDSIRSIAFYFDAFIVGTSGVDYLFKFALSSEGGGAKVNFLRMARLIKLVKLFRAF